MRDKISTMFYIFRLTVAGIDELAFFTIAPHPGSALFEDRKIRSIPDQLVTFSGHGRQLEWEVKAWRKLYIFYYLLMKMIRPFKSFGVLIRMFQFKPETKTENILARISFIKKNLKHAK
jgi:hypothetical protein